MMTNKNWYKSKTKWAGILTGVGVFLPSLVSYLNGGMDFPLADIWYGAAIILTVFGIRDLPLINTIKA